MKKKLYACIGPLIILFLWFLASRLMFADSVLLPDPIETIATLFRIFFTGDILGDLSATLIRTIAVFMISVSIGLPLGLILGSKEIIYRSIEFIIDFFRSTPATAIFPLFLIFFGVSNTAKILAASFGATLIILFHTAYGVIHSKKSRILAAKLMGSSRKQIFKWIVFWESLPQTFVGLRNAVSISLAIIIVLEMFIGTNIGLGKRIIDAQIVYSITEMYAIILITGILGYLLNYGLLISEKRVIHWTAH